MPRYIDAEAAVALIELNYCEGCNSYNGIRCGTCGLDDAISMINDVPTADVVPKSNQISTNERSLENRAIADYIEKVKYELCMTNGRCENEQIFDILDRVANQCTTQTANKEV